MISTLICDSQHKELQYIYSIIKDQAAYLTDEYWKFVCVRSVNEALMHMESLEFIDVACMEIRDKQEISCVEDMRKRHKQVFLLLIADATLSPVYYLKPSIMASSLLLRPCKQADIDRSIKEFVEAYMEQRENKGITDSCIIDSKEGKLHIPYAEIYYFEAREKKVFVNTANAEYSFCSTIERLEQELPPFFVRCHRSFIVNVRKIFKVMLSQNMICLKEEREVPLSRSYKSAFKELGKHGNK